MKKMAALVFIIATQSTGVLAGDLCSNEKIFFSCNLEDKRILTVCGDPLKEKLVYQMQKQKKIEFSYDRFSKFSFKREISFLNAVDELTFNTGPYKYVIKHEITKPQDKIKLWAGVTVFKNDKLASKLQCSDREKPFNKLYLLWGNVKD